jgi:hypothetical protein
MLKISELVFLGKAMAVPYCIIIEQRLLYSKIGSHICKFVRLIILIIKIIMFEGGGKVLA